MINRMLRIYFSLPSDSSLGIVSKVINRLIAKLLKRLLDYYVPYSLERKQEESSSGLNQNERDQKLLVSLTSFPGRIDSLWIVIESLLRQTYKPDRLILWLSKLQFESIELPEKLLSLQAKGLEIRFVDDDLRSHKKYYYALDSYKKYTIITFDDDVFYDNRVIERLVHGSRLFPDCVIANRAHEITFDKETVGIKPYREWRHHIRNSRPSFLYVPTGVGGVLYPPGSLSDRILDITSIKEKCFLADDLWLKAGTLLTNTKVFVTDSYNQEFITVGRTQVNKLVTSNSLNGGNDKQLQNTLVHFGIDLKLFV